MPHFRALDASPYCFATGRPGYGSPNFFGGIAMFMALHNNVRRDERSTCA
jgi:hypothetical protein